MGTNANQAFREIEEGKSYLIIPAIVIAEIIFLVQKGKIKADLDALLLKIQESNNFQISNLGLNELLCLKDHTEIPEMHDRFIVCEAFLKKAKIITNDREIKDTNIVTVWDTSHIFLGLMSTIKWFKDNRSNIEQSASFGPGVSSAARDK